MSDKSSYDRRRFLRDAAVTVAATMKAAADNVQALVVANSAHFVAEEAPDQLLAALVPFLTS